LILLRYRRFMLVMSAYFEHRPKDKIGRNHRQQKISMPELVGKQVF